MPIDEKAFMEAWEQVSDGSDDCCLKHRMQRFLEAYEAAKVMGASGLSASAASAAGFATRKDAEAEAPATQQPVENTVLRSETPVKVCPECDIAGCRHIRNGGGTDNE